MDPLQLQNILRTLNEGQSGQSSTEKIVDPSKLLALPKGTVLAAHVKAVRSLNEAERSSLLSILNKRSNQQSSAPSDSAKAAKPTLTAQASSTNQTLSSQSSIGSNTTAQNIDTLLKQTQLYLIQLKTQMGTVLSFSETKLSTKQNVSMRVSGEGHVIVQNMPMREKQANSSSVEGSSQTLQTNKPTHSLAQASLKGSTNLEVTKNSEILSAAQRQYLPNQQKLSVSLNQLGKVLNQLESIIKQNTAQTSTQQTHLRTASQEQSSKAPKETHFAGKDKQSSPLEILQSILKKVMDTSQGISAKQVQSAVREQGYFLESKLHKISQNTVSENTIKPEQDVKAQLLQLLEHLPPANTASNKANAKTNTDGLLANALMLLLRPLGSSKNQADKHANAKIWLSENIRPIIEQLTARVTTLQLQSLSRQIQEGQANHLHLELPIRFQEQYLPIHIELFPWFKKISKDEKEEQKKANKKKMRRCWRLLLEMELNDNDRFLSEIDYDDDKMSARLWSDTPEIRQKIQKRLEKLQEKLQASGINIERIRIAHTQKPQDICKLTHNLVDITT